MKERKFSVFRLLFGVAFQIAFAEGFLLIVRHFLAEDPEALARYPIVRIVLYVFWAPFMINGIRTYIRDWKIAAAKKKTAGTGADTAKKAGRAASAKGTEKKEAEEAKRRLRNKVDAEKEDRAREQAELERERAERDRQNREWQKQTTNEQRRQNADRDQARQAEADRKRAEAAQKAKEEEERQRRQDKLAEKYWYTENDPKKLREAFEREQEYETGVGESYRTAGNIMKAVESLNGIADKGCEWVVNVAAEYDKSGGVKIVKVVRDGIKPILVDPMESLSRRDYAGILKSLVTGLAKGPINAVQDIMPTGVENVNVVLEGAKARLECWRTGITDPEAVKNEIEKATRARAVYERTGTAVRIGQRVMGIDAGTAEQIGNAVKETTSLYTNYSETERAAREQAARVKKTAAPSRYLTDLQNRIREFKRTKKHIDLT